MYYEILISISRLIYRMIFDTQIWKLRSNIYCTLSRSYVGLVRKDVLQQRIYLSLFRTSILRIRQNEFCTLFFPSFRAFKALYSLLKFHFTKTLPFESKIDRHHIFFKVVTAINGIKRILFTQLKLTLRLFWPAACAVRSREDIAFCSFLKRQGIFYRNN